MFHPPRCPVPVILAVGGNESPAWLEENAAYARVCERAGCAVERIVVEGAGHFTMIPAQADPAHPVNRAILERLRALMRVNGES